MLTKVSGEDKEIMLMGDLNVDLSNAQKNTKLGDITDSVQLKQIIEEPTRVVSHVNGKSETLIDHIYVSDTTNVLSSRVLPFDLSDHFAVFLSYHNKSLKESTNCHKILEFRSQKKFNVDDFLCELQSVPWETIYLYTDPNEALSAWYDMFTNVLDKLAPLVKKRVKYWHQPKWMTPDVLEAINKRKYFRSNNMTAAYKRQRNLVKSMMKKAKSDYYNSMLRNSSDTKNMWNCIKQLGDSKKCTNGPTVLKGDDGTIISDPFDIATVFNEHFSKIQADIANSESDECKLNQSESFKKLEEFVASKMTPAVNFDIPLMTVEYVCKQLSTFQINKAKGVDNISPYFFKIAAPIIAPSLCHIFNCSIVSRMFPDKWKVAKVTPLHKKDAKECKNNYRPISVLCTLSKILEKHVHQYFYEYLAGNNLLHPSQSGFRSKYSCSTALTHMVENWLTAVDSGQMIGTVLVDFQKAFDSVDHSLLLKKLHLYGCSEHSLCWFRSYLQGRSQHVCIKNVSSDTKPVICGVPQGSVLGPLLFLLFINDLPLHLSSESDLYADDTSVYVVGRDLSEIETKLNADMEKLNNWCIDNKIRINVNKTKCMLIMTPQRRARLPDGRLNIKINNTAIPYCDGDKILGVYVNNSFDWSKHVSNVCTAINYRLSILRRIKAHLSLTARTVYCNSYILPSFDYCCTVWGNTTQENIMKLFRLQKYAARLVFDDFESSSSDLLEKLKWLPINYRIDLNKLLLVFKSLNGLAPDYLTSKFNFRNNIHYAFRSVSDECMLIPKHQTETFKKSLAYSGSKLWNSLPISIKQSKSFDQFKNECTLWLKERWQNECV